MSKVQCTPTAAVSSLHQILGSATTTSPARQSDLARTDPPLLTLLSDLDEAMDASDKILQSNCWSTTDGDKTSDTQGLQVAFQNPRPEENPPVMTDRSSQGNSRSGPRDLQAPQNLGSQYTEDPPAAADKFLDGTSRFCPQGLQGLFQNLRHKSAGNPPVTPERSSNSFSGFGSQDVQALFQILRPQENPPVTAYRSSDGSSRLIPQDLHVSFQNLRHQENPPATADRSSYGSGTLKFAPQYVQVPSQNPRPRNTETSPVTPDRCPNDTSRFGPQDVQVPFQNHGAQYVANPPVTVDRSPDGTSRFGPQDSQIPFQNITPQNTDNPPAMTERSSDGISISDPQDLQPVLCQNLKPPLVTPDRCPDDTSRLDPQDVQVPFQNYGAQYVENPPVTADRSPDGTSRFSPPDSQISFQNIPSQNTNDPATADRSSDGISRSGPQDLLPVPSQNLRLQDAENSPATADGSSDGTIMKSSLKLLSGVELYKCSNCAIVLCDPSALQAHRRIHDSPDESGHLSPRGSGVGDCTPDTVGTDRKGTHHSSVGVFGDSSVTSEGGRRTHQCTFCMKLCEGSSALRVHERVHTKERPYQCNFCGRAFSQARSWRLHQAVHTGREDYMCRYCARAFSGPQALNQHEQLHRQRRMKVEREGHATKPWINNIQAGSNFRRKIGGIENPNTNEGPIARSPISEASDKLLDGDMAEDTLGRPYICFKCNQPYLYVPYSSIKIEPQLGTRGQHVCRSRPHALNQSNSKKRNNELDHTDERQYWCTLCSKVFHEQWALKVHFLVHSGKSGMGVQGKGDCMVTRTGKLSYPSELGKKLFVQMSHLRIYKRAVLGQRPHRCGECEKSFTSGETLKLHEMSHNGRRRSKCKVCGKAFTSRTMKRHEKVHAARECQPLSLYRDK